MFGMYSVRIRFFFLNRGLRALGISAKNEADCRQSSLTYLGGSWWNFQSWRSGAILGSGQSIYILSALRIFDRFVCRDAGAARRGPDRRPRIVYLSRQVARLASAVRLSEFGESSGGERKREGEERALPPKSEPTLGLGMRRTRTREIALIHMRRTGVGLVN